MGCCGAPRPCFVQAQGSCCHMRRAPPTQLSCQALGQMVSVWNDTGRLRFYSRTPSSLHALYLWLLGGQTNSLLLTAPPRGHILCSWLPGFQKVSAGLRHLPDHLLLVETLKYRDAHHLKHPWHASPGWCGARRQCGDAPCRFQAAGGGDRVTS